MSQGFSDRSFSEISVEALAERLAMRAAQADETPLQLVDVREPGELELSSLDGFVNLPLSQAEEWTGNICDRLNPAVETLVLCHHGMRSAQMCQWLVNQGFTQVKNISGGIDAYSIRVDRTVPRY